MRIEYLIEDRLQDFIDFCKTNRNQVDDSFLYDEDLRDFKLDQENPTYIVLDDQSNIIGGVSLIKNAYFKRGKKARFRIFHSVDPDPAIYKLLFKIILPHTADLNEVFLFIGEDNVAVRDIYQSMNFEIERYAYFLIRDEGVASQPVIPKEYSFKTFEFDRDEEDYLTVRNAGFATLKGSETPMTLNEVMDFKKKEDYIDGGIFLLYHSEKPIGVVRCTKEVYNDEDVLNIGPLALIPEYQGKGLGRQLLRKALEFGQTNGLPKTILSANADNERAVQLYTKEGFTKEESMVCYHYQL